MRANWPLWALVVPCALVALYAASRDVFWTGDFYLEAYPAYQALMAGDVDAFFAKLPGYSGFTVTVGGPAALLTDLTGGAENAALRFSALPGLVASCALAVAVAGPVRASGNRWWPAFLLLAAGGPIGYAALQYGHPEDVLATALAVGGVLAARNGRIAAACVLVVAAVVAKQWAVLAILPAAAVAPRRGLVVAGAGAAGTLLLLYLQTQEGGAVHGTITDTGLLFHPHQIWWPLGVPATPEFAAAGHGERMGPEWLAPLTRPLIVGGGALLAAAWWARGGARRAPDDVFALLALCFLLRCMLDPWNLVYYQLPLIVSLTVWEARRDRPLPVLAVVVTAACWLGFVSYDERTGNGPYLLYLAWSVPLAAWLALTLVRGPRHAAGTAPARVVPAPA